MSDKTYYETLNIGQNATASEIKKAYKKQAMKYHPDRNESDPTAEEKFKEINAAYQVLGDEEKRGIYDRYGEEGLNGNRGGGGFSSSNMSDIFEDLFGGGGGRRQQRESRPYEIDCLAKVNLSFTQAVFGCKKDIKYTYKTACDTCNATGAKGGQFSTCGTCNGEGQVYVRQSFVTIGQTCPACRGAGRAPADTCTDCNGKSYKSNQHNLLVDIPEGIDNGMRIRVANKGNSYKGSRGDLYIEANVTEDEHFIRDNTNVYLEVPIFFTDILLEKKIEVPALTGNIDLYLTKNMKDKEQCVFKSKGIKDVRSNKKGSFVVQLSIKYPKKIDATQKELLAKLDQSFKEQNSFEDSFLDSMMNKVKDWAKQ